MGLNVIIPNKGTITTHEVLPSDLIAYYRFEEPEGERDKALDWAMNFDAVTRPQRGEGYLAQGLLCDKESVNFSDTMVLDEIPSTQEFTVEFWVKFLEELKRGEHGTYTLFSKQWASGMKMYAYIVTRLESLRLHLNLSYLVSSGDSIGITGATWGSLNANGLYYKTSDILYRHSLNPEWQIVLDEGVWKIQKDVEGEWITHFTRDTDVAGDYAATAYGSGDVSAAAVTEVNDIIDIPLTSGLPVDEWMKCYIVAHFEPTTPTGFGIWLGDYSSKGITSEIVDLPVNVNVDPQLIGGDNAPLMLGSNDSTIPYIVDGHPFPSSHRHGIEAVIDEVKIWRGMQKPAPITHPPTLSVVVEGLGEVEKNPDKEEYNFNEEVILTAIPEEEDCFLGWHGDLTGDENPVTIVMDGDKHIIAEFSGKVATPEIVPAGGTYLHSLTVEMSCFTADAVIRYTTDGSEPTEASAEYTEPFEIAESAVVKAKGFLEGWQASETRTETYELKVSPPTFEPGPGTYKIGG